MNKKIKELAEQARNYALDEKRIYERVHNTEQCMEVYREVYNKKFAELIVRECAEQIKAQGISASSEDYGDYEIGFNAGLFHALRTTIEHFGVE